MKILPIIDTNRIGGPGKGLISLIKLMKSKCDFPGVVIFQRKNNNKHDFMKALVRENIVPIVISERWPFDPLSFWYLYKLIRKHRPDIVQTHGYKASFLILLLSRFRLINRKILWMAWVHGWTAENYKVKVYQFIEKISVLWSDRIICVSAGIAKTFNLMKRKITIVPNGVDEDYNVIEKPDLLSMRKELGIGNRKVIVVIGRFSYEKGIDRIPYIAAELKKRRDDFVFVLIGEGLEKNNVIEAAKKMGIYEQIVFHLFTSDVRPYYRLADICLLPSRMEGMPNVVIEALYMKCLMISFDVGGVREIIRHNREGVLIAPDDLDDVVNSIDRLLDDKESAMLMKKAGKLRIEKEFLNSIRAKRVFDLYSQYL